MSDLLFDRRVFLSAAACACASGARAGGADDQQIVFAGEPFDVSHLAPGAWLVAMVDADPVFVRRRTPTEIARVRGTPMSDLPDPARDEQRAPGSGEWLTVLGVCTHARCRPTAGLGPFQGWLCLCHGSVYDLSGRVRHGPAKRNLAVVEHRLTAGGAMVLLSS